MSGELSNGYPARRLVLAGAASPIHPRPVIGRLRARVAYPLEAPATVVGPFGRGWKCDLAAARAKGTQIQPDATLVHWIVEAPWSHEVVHSYSLLLIHLRPVVGLPPAKPYLVGATHEFALWPLLPHISRAELLTGPPRPDMWISPAAFMGQIIEPSDAAAEERVTTAVVLVCGGRLSPHPDHARSWAEIFGDSMLRHAMAPE